MQMQEQTQQHKPGQGHFFKHQHPTYNLSLTVLFISAPTTGKKKNKKLS
jgi:hypothetical protein